MSENRTYAATLAAMQQQTAGAIFQLAELASGRAGMRWDSGIARYRSNATGRIVSADAARAAVDQYNNAFVRANVANQTERFVDGATTIDQWQRGMRKEIKDAWIVNVVVGRGGRQQVTAADWGRVGGRLAFQYRHLDQFAREIAAGDLSEAQIKARAAMYAAAARTGFFDGQRGAGGAAGHTQERRILNPAEHCGDCVGYAGRGWVPIGTLPPPGVGSECLTNCRCDMQTRPEPDLNE